MISLFDSSKNDWPKNYKWQLQRDMTLYKKIELMELDQSQTPLRWFEISSNDFDLSKITRNIKTAIQKKEVRDPLPIFNFSKIDLEDLYPFPVIQENFEVRRSTEIPLISFIIPCYNNFTYLKMTLLHLLKMETNYPFEIIIIDDGSDDTNTRDFANWCDQNCSRFAQVKYIYFAREKKRKMGDQLFRAGIARNLGGIHAKSEVLSFLDSDVLVHKGYANEILNSLKPQTILQTRRFDLNRESSFNPRYEDIGKANCLFDDPYWNDFHHSSTPWMEMKDFWKYTCSHSLSMLKSDFQDVGWFRPEYNFYGFEDTDLGFRSCKKNIEFKLLVQPSFHLYHRPERSEFMQNANLRQLLLKKSCRKFLQYNPFPEVLDTFSFYLS